MKPELYVALENSSKLPKLPLIATGNDLRSGAIVYLGASGWTTVFAEALVATDEATARRLEADLAAAEHDVIGSYLVTVALGAGGGTEPAHYREAIRRTGPTVAYGDAA